MRKRPSDGSNWDGLVQRQNEKNHVAITQQDLPPSCVVPPAKSFSAAAAISPIRIASSQHAHFLVCTGSENGRAIRSRSSPQQKICIRNCFRPNPLEGKQGPQKGVLCQRTRLCGDSPIVSNTHVKATLPSTSFSFPSRPPTSPWGPKIASPSPLAIHALLIPISLHGT